MVINKRIYINTLYDNLFNINDKTYTRGDYILKYRDISVTVDLGSETPSDVEIGIFDAYTFEAILPYQSITSIGNEVGVSYGGFDLTSTEIAFIISDGEADNILTNFDNCYSTTELLIGTYLNKPLYRKVLQFDGRITPTPNSVVVLTHNLDIEKYIRTDFLLNNLNTDTSVVHSSEDFISKGYSSGIINFTDNEIQIKPYENFTDPAMWEIILEYTKTSDPVIPQEVIDANCLVNPLT